MRKDGARSVRAIRPFPFHSTFFDSRNILYSRGAAGRFLCLLGLLRWCIAWATKLTPYCPLCKAWLITGCFPYGFHHFIPELILGAFSCVWWHFPNMHPVEYRMILPAFWGGGVGAFLVLAGLCCRCDLQHSLAMPLWDGLQ